MRLRTAILALLALASPATAYAHGKLESSSPASGAHLQAPPRELRLTFTEAPELAFSRVTLLGADGSAVALGELTRAPDASTLVTAITVPLKAGVYRVHWQMAGRDGHPVRGEFSFTVDAQATVSPPGEAAGGVGAPGQPTPPAEHHMAAETDGNRFDASSWPYVVIRWITFAALLLVIGAVAFRFAVLRTLRRRHLPEALTASAAAGAARIASWSALLLLVAALGRLYAQSVAMHGSARALEPGLVTTMLVDTVWGWGWLLQVVAATVGIAVFRAASRGHRAGWWLGAACALALAFTPGLAGHAIAAPALTTWLLLADTAHVIGASGWLGSLFVMMAAGMPAALGPEEAERGGAVAELVNAFSPTALVFAGMTAAAGVFAAWIHLGSVPALWSTSYGRTLLLKLAILSVVAGTGAYNWLRVRPALGDVAGARRIRRSSTVELIVAVAVLAVTAALVATPTPHEVPSVNATMGH